MIKTNPDGTISCESLEDVHNKFFFSNRYKDLYQLKIKEDRVFKREYSKYLKSHWEHSYALFYWELPPELKVINEYFSQNNTIYLDKIKTTKEANEWMRTSPVLLKIQYIYQKQINRGIQI